MVDFKTILDKLIDNSDDYCQLYAAYSDILFLHTDEEQKEIIGMLYKRIPSADFGRYFAQKEEKDTDTLFDKMPNSDEREEEEWQKWTKRLDNLIVLVKEQCGSSESFDENNKEILPEHSFLYDSPDFAILFFSNKIEEFKYVERELVRQGFVNRDGEWKEDKKELVQFIIELQENDFLKKKASGKTENTTQIAIRRFFEKRYSASIINQMKPSARRKINFSGVFYSVFNNAKGDLK